MPESLLFAEKRVVKGLYSEISVYNGTPKEKNIVFLVIYIRERLSLSLIHISDPRD